MYISVIIPVFNVENFLVQCINTLLSQKNCSLEFIFINDASTDRSLEILKEFAKKDRRIIIIDNNQVLPVWGPMLQGLFFWLPDCYW